MHKKKSIFLFFVMRANFLLLECTLSVLIWKHIVIHICIYIGVSILSILYLRCVNVVLCVMSSFKFLSH